MKNLTTCTLVAILVLASANSILADGKNWSDAKRQSVESNRELNSGHGNGGETYGGGSYPTEIERGDRDPGKSGSKCQGGKNNNTGGGC